MAWLDAPMLLMLTHVALAITLIEVIALVLYQRIAQRRLVSSAFFWHVGSGLCLMLALRSVLAASPAYITALCLLASGIVHVAGLWRESRA